MISGSLRVRRATPADKEAVVALSRAVSEDDFIPAAYDEWMTYSGEEGFYVAEEGGRILGCYCLETHAPGQGYLYAMRIHPDAQGRGLGSLLCRMQVEQARFLGTEEVYLFSALENHRAHRTVEKNGFVNRGAWLVYDELKGLPPLPAGRARRARPGDGAAVAAFRQRQEATSLSGVIASRHSCWAVVSATPGDWDLADAVVVEGGDSLVGVMLCAANQEGLLVRWLSGTPEAAADLLAFAVQEVESRALPYLAISLPMSAEPLLAPLSLRPDTAFRAYVFHRSLKSG